LQSGLRHVPGSTCPSQEQIDAQRDGEENPDLQRPTDTAPPPGALDRRLAGSSRELLLLRA
jgi:hypothetical protein